MKVGDLVRMTPAATSLASPPKGIIISSVKPAGYYRCRHTILWDDGHVSEIPEDVLMKVRFDNSK